MGRYTDFSLLWTSFGGYANREEAFGLPSIVCVIAKEGRACRFHTWREPVSASDVRDLATWHDVPAETFGELRRLLDDIGAFGDLKPLLKSDGESPYFVSWEFTGTDAGRPFHFCLEWKAPGEVWTTDGERFRKVINSLGRRDGSRAASHGDG